MRHEPTHRIEPRTRRQVLRAGALAALTAPFVAACATDYQEGPDPLAPLREQARADAEVAQTLTTSTPDNADVLNQVVAVRSAQAEALKSEVDRQNRPASGNRNQRPSNQASSVDDIKRRLESAQQKAVELVPTLPTYRAGLVAAVAAGCAATRQLSSALGAGRTNDETGAVPAGGLPEADVQAMQTALASEHAAIWAYELVAAFLPNEFRNGLDEGTKTHQDLRNSCESMITDAGAAPKPAESAYVPPQPVTDQNSAMALLATAESDAAAAWRGVIERTDRGELRTMAAQVMISSASRATRWRIETGEEPAVIALPGQPEHS